MRAHIKVMARAKGGSKGRNGSGLKVQKLVYSERCFTHFHSAQNLEIIYKNKKYVMNGEKACREKSRNEPHTLRKVKEFSVKKN